MRKNWKKRVVSVAMSLLLLGLLTGCSTSAGTNAEIYLSNMSRILFSSSSSSSTSSGDSSTDASSDTTVETVTVDAPADFTVDGETYSFTAVDGASQYLLCLCEAGSTDDDDSYLYSGVISDDGSDSYTGTISDVVSHAYGSYTAKVFALDDSYNMSTGATADYTISGELPAPELAYSWDGSSLSLQVANTDDYDDAATPDEITVTLSGPDGEQTASFDSTMADIEVADLTAGDYSIQATASSSSEYVTSATSEVSSLDVTLGEEELVSDNYVEAQQNGGGDMGGWEVTPTDVSFEEGSASFAFTIGDQPFFETTATLQDTPDDGAAYTYVLENGDPAAPFEITMMLELYEDGTAELSVTAGGPINATNVTGTWTAADGMITVTW